MLVSAKDLMEILQATRMLGAIFGVALWASVALLFLIANSDRQQHVHMWLSFLCGNTAVLLWTG